MIATVTNFFNHETIQNSPTFLLIDAHLKVNSFSDKQITYLLISITHHPTQVVAFVVVVVVVVIVASLSHSRVVNEFLFSTRLRI